MLELRPRPRTRRLATLLCALAAGATVAGAGQVPRIERDVSYSSVPDADRRLDLSVPATPGFATVIFIHGGSLQEGGDRRTTPLYAGVCAPLVAAGIGCATIDYRLAPSSKWPAMPNDVAAAVQWVRSHISERGGDPKRLILFGHSSGCHLAAVLATNPKYLAGVGLQTTDISGIVAMGCVLAPLEESTTKHSIEELRTSWPKSSDTSTYATFDDRLDSDPSRFLGPHVPPILVVCADAERFFPSILEEGAKFVRRLLELKRPANLIIVPGRHVTSIAQFGAPGDPTFAVVKAFVNAPSDVAPKNGGL